MKHIVAIKRFIFLSILLLGVHCASSARAAQLDLTDVPLFLNINVVPNIMFLIDDSGTMDFEVMTPDAEGGLFRNTQPDGTDPGDAGTIKHRDDNDDGVPDCAIGAGGGQTFNGYIYGVDFAGNTYPDGGGKRCNIADDRAWRFRNSDFNVLYFDPTKTYKPWTGLDPNGVPYADMPITAAKDNPANPASATINLLIENSGKGLSNDWDGDGTRDGFRYYTWQDLDGDGNFDNGEETEYLIKDQDAATQQNFANWFSYHRRRGWVAKSVYGDIIADMEGVRMGLATFYNSGGANTEIRFMPDKDFTSGDKLNLMNNLYAFKGTVGQKVTRAALRATGQYFECAVGGQPPNLNDCPRLEAADGGTCQQNFLLMMTDGAYGGTLTGIGNADGDNSSKYDKNPHYDKYDNTVADVAMHYYERDLHPDLDDNVPTSPGVDEATHQHMVTYVISFGPEGTLTDNPEPGSCTINDCWPDPDPPGPKATNNKAKIDDLRHAAYNGRGLFLNAKKPEELAEALKDALTNVAERTSSAASVALNSGSQNANSRVYQARFNSAGWTGQLLSFPINNDGSVATPEWDTSIELDSLDWDTQRVILTYKSDSKDGVPFRWGNLSAGQQTQLNTNSGGVNDGQGSSRLEFLRGSNANEGAGLNYRPRSTRLGDLINSDPFYVGDPGFPDSIGAGYNAFRTAKNGRTPMVYVGGNDGMLHGFNANSGKEEMAFVPNSVFGNLSRLTNAVYKHRFFVDGSPTVGDATATFPGCGGGDCWRSILVSGLRGGGQGFFALDVTNPSQFSEAGSAPANTVLWEFTDADDADLGYTFSQPSIVRMANGEWAAIAGNGYNNSEADGNASITGLASLFVLFLDAGIDDVWTPGVDYRKIATTVGTTTTPNGLATPAAADIDGDFTVDYIYAGDLEGNVWRYDVRDPIPANWPLPVKVFTAKSSDIDPVTLAPLKQSITSRVQVGEHPDPTQPGVIVYVGTGKYIEDADNVDTIPTQTFYAFWDKLDAVPAVVTRGDLQEQTVLLESGGQRITSDNEVDWTTQRGWYIDLPVDGERVVSNPVLRNERIIFTTLIPNTQICGFGGTSWLMEMSAFTGGRLEDSPFDLNGDKMFDDSDKVSVTISGNNKLVSVSGLQSTEGILPTPTILSAGETEIKFNSGSKGGIYVTVENPGPGASGRIAWRQFQ